MEDASLDDFLETGAESSDENEVTAASSTTDEASESSTDPATDPASEDEGSAAGTDDAHDPAEADGETGVAAVPTHGDVEPARSTMTFSPDPGECAACGEAVTRHWTDGDALVCRDCKEW